MSVDLERRFGQQYLNRQVAAAVGARRQLKPFPVGMSSAAAASQQLMQLQKQPFMMGGLQPPQIGPSIFRGTYVSNVPAADPN